MSSVGRALRRFGRRQGYSVVAVAAAVLTGALFGLQYQQNHKERERAIATSLTGGDPDQAPLLIRRFGCGGCHTISGVDGADGKVGPPLGNLRKRVYVAGLLRNTPESLIQWIAAPQTISPQSAMPDTGITPQEARHVAAFLYSN